MPTILSLVKAIEERFSPIKKAIKNREEFNKKIQLSRANFNKLIDSISPNTLPNSKVNEELKRLGKSSVLMEFAKQCNKHQEFNRIKNNTVNSFTVSPFHLTSNKATFKIDIIKKSDEIDVDISEEEGGIVITVKKSTRPSESHH